VATCRQQCDAAETAHKHLRQGKVPVGSLIEALIPLVESRARRFVATRHDKGRGRVGKRLQLCDVDDLCQAALLELTRKCMTIVKRSDNYMAFIKCVSRLLKDAFSEWLADSSLCGPSPRSIRRQRAANKRKSICGPDCDGTCRACEEWHLRHDTLTENYAREHTLDSLVAKQADHLIFVEVQEDLHAACKTETEHTIVTLRLEGHSDYEIAAVLNQPQSNVSRARQRICKRAGIGTKHNLALGA